ncbi:MAG: hypothetical protein AAGI38_03475 [Bacteroidota bacterium]
MHHNSFPTVSLLPGKSNLLILLVLLLGFSFTQRGYSQTDAPGIPFVTYWSTSDTFEFKITKRVQKWEEEKLVKNDSSTYNGTITVVDSTPDGYLLKWRYTTNLTTDYNIPPKIARRLSKYRIRDIQYRISEVGEFQGVDNWKEIAKVFNAMFDEFMDLLIEESPENRAAVKKVIKPLRATFGSKEGVEIYVLKELQYIHYPFGVEFYEGEEITYQDSYSNMFGGRPIKGNVKLYVDSVDYDDAYCVLIHEMKLDEEDAKKMMEGVAQKLLASRKGSTKKKVVEIINNASIEFSDHNRFEYYYYPGIPLHIDIKRIVNYQMDETKTYQINQVIIDRIN